MNRLRKIIVGMLVVLMCVTGMQYETKAESAQITLTSTATTCEVGSEITVTINIGASNTIMAYDLTLSYDSSILDFVSASNEGNGGGGNLMWISRTEGSQTVKFRAKAAGTAKLSTKLPILGIGLDDNPTITNGSLGIIVNPKYVASTNNNLASLTVGGAALSPGFAANTTAYTCNVAANVSTLVVTAKQADSKAKVAVAGNTNLKYGRNEIVVTVTAESGATKRYVIVCNRATPPAQQTTAAAPTQAPTEAPKPKVIVNDSIYYVSVKGASNWPAGFTAQNLDYKGTAVVGGYNEKNNMYLMQLEAEGAEKATALYVYNAEKDSFTKFVSVNNVANTFIVIPLANVDEKLEGYKTVKKQIGDNEVDVYAKDDIYGIFYAMDAEGNLGWYRFCSADKTVQKYVPTASEIVGDKEVESESGENITGGSNKDNGGLADGMWKAIALVSMAVAVGFLIAIIALIVKHKKDMDEAEFDALYAAMPNKTGSARFEFAAATEPEEKVAETEQEEMLELVEEEETITLEIEEIADDTKKSE